MLGRAAQVEHSLDPCGRWSVKYPTKPRLTPLKNQTDTQPSPSLHFESNSTQCATTDAYVAPNKTIPQLHEMLRTGAEIDPLKDFAEAARDELSSL